MSLIDAVKRANITDFPRMQIGGRYYVVALLALVNTFNMIDRQILSILLEPIKRDLHVSDTQMGLLTGFAFAVFYVLMGLPIARWSDVGVRRSIIAMAIGVWSFMTVVSGFANNYLHLLIARIGVASGEAGSQPATWSIVSDLFPVHLRGRAFSMISVGSAGGILLGLFLGGVLNDLFGWRAAFIIVGAPGLILALIVRFTIKEPPRPASTTGHDDIPSLKETLKYLWGMKSLRWLTLGMSVHAMAGYGIMAWTPAFFIRLHGLSTTEIGLWVGLATGGAFMVGNLTSGFLTDFLIRRDIRFFSWCGGTGTVLCIPLGIFAFTVLDPRLAIVLLFPFQLLMTFIIVPINAYSQSVALPRMRALTSAIITSCQNLVGIGLGPLTAGILNDVLTPSFGVEAVRYSLLIMCGATLTGGLMVLYASRWMKQDFSRAQTFM